MALEETHLVGAGKSWQDCREPPSPRALMAGLWQPACPLPRRVRSFALLLPLAGSCVPLAQGTPVRPVLLGSFSSSPAALRVGRGRRLGLLPGVPLGGGGGGEGAGWSRLDWMSLGGEDRMSFLARSLPWKTGAVGRRSGTHGGGCWEFLSELLWVWNILTHSWSLSPALQV